MYGELKWFSSASFMAEITFDHCFVLVLGAASYRVTVTNAVTNEVQELRSAIASIDVQSLAAGTFYNIQVFSIGEEQSNSVGSEVVARQTGEMIHQ